MINEKEIMPFNFFKYGGIYTGGHNGMRYKIERTGEKPDYVLNVLSGYKICMILTLTAGKMHHQLIR